MNNLIQGKQDKRQTKRGGERINRVGEIQSCSFINLRKVGPLRRPKLETDTRARYVKVGIVEARLTWRTKQTTMLSCPG